MSESKFTSIHRHPRPRVQMFTRVAVACGLSGAAVACVLQIVLAITLAPLFLITALFTALLSIPLLLLSVLHPEVRVSAAGLRLTPLIGQPQTVSWDDLSTLTDHPLIYEDPVISRRLYGKKYRLREGKVIVMRRSAPLSWRYRVLGVVSGTGWTPAFAISSTTDTDYEALVEILSARLEARDS